MDVKQIRYANLIALIAKAGSTAKLAKRVGTDASYISQITGPKAKRNVGDEFARQLERAMGMTFGWMDHDHSAEGEINIEYNARNLKAVYEISWVQAGRFNGVEDFYDPGDGTRAVYTTAQVGERAFALKVRGDSMTNGAGGRSYPDGCTIIVDPSRQAKPGDRVIVRIDDNEEATFKQLDFDGVKYYLKPLNQRYPIMEMPENARIIGVVVQTLIDE